MSTTMNRTNTLSLKLIGACLAALTLTGVVHAAAQPGQPAAPAAADPGKTEPAKAEPKTEPKAEAPAAKPAAKEEPKLSGDFVYINMSTSMGDIVLELNNAKAPISTKNFVSYVNKKHYDGTIFHRVIEKFMVQGGGFDKDMKERPVDAPIQNEWQNGLKNVRGTLAMARTQVANSATSQFFINVVDNPFLDQARDGAGYAVFGKIHAGMDVVDKIRMVRTANKGPHQNVPAEPVVINTATVISKEEADKAAAKK